MAYSSRAGLLVATELAEFIEREALLGIGIDAARFWAGAGPAAGASEQADPIMTAHPAM